jgi:hypothetical protein
VREGLSCLPRQLSAQKAELITVRIGQYVPSVIAPLPDVHRPGTGGAARIRHRGRERIVLNPYRPGFPGEAAFSGKLSHVADYRSPAPYAGRRVIVVGGVTPPIRSPCRHAALL